MNTKLTLSIEESLIDRAKSYAASRKTSLSRLVEEYIKSLTESNPTEIISLSPITRDLATMIKPKGKMKNIDTKSILAESLLEKHK